MILMNKKEVNKYLKFAYAALKDSNIVKDGKITGNYPAQISSFGAAVNSGSVLTAIAFFSNKKGSDHSNKKVPEIDRPELMKVIYKTIILKKEIRNRDLNIQNFFEDVSGGNIKKNQVLEAAVAVKLAMNLFEQKDKEKRD